MKPLQIMLIAGEASGDLLAAELVGALREELIAGESTYTRDLQPLKTALEPRFFGAGGPRMKAAGVALAVDLTQHSVTGFSDVAKNYFKFRRLFLQLLQLAIERQPDVIIGVDYGGFNLRFAHAVRRYVRSRSGWFHGWRPKLVQYVSPQVWASRASRAWRMARDHDLVLSIFPFEKEWYAERVPQLRVEFVGHPVLDRLQPVLSHDPKLKSPGTPPLIILLPGSREGELRRHWPVMLGTAVNLFSKARFLAVVPSEKLRDLLRSIGRDGQFVLAEMLHDHDSHFNIQVGGLPEALAQADLAIASTGTVTMECACFGVPAITVYKTSWATYEIARHLVTVKSLTMPNLLANQEIYPEFIQQAATAETISKAALELLTDEPRRARIKEQLAKVIASLGGLGATRRAAQAVARLVQPQPR